jgi:hypothetical protein
MFYTYVFLVDKDCVEDGYKVIHKTLMKVFKDYYASKPRRAYKGVTYVNKYPPFDQAIHVKSVTIPLDRFITDSYTGRVAHTWFGASNEDEGNEQKSEQELYENLNSNKKYPNFADTIFSRKQFVGKYCYTACNTYGYPKDGIAIKQEDTLTEEEEKIVNGNAMLLSISDHSMNYKVRLNPCLAEAIVAKKTGKSMEKYQLKKDVDLKRTVTVNDGKKVESPNQLTIAADAEDDDTRDA